MAILRRGLIRKGLLTKMVCGTAVSAFRNCEACELCQTRKNVVIGRGDIDADLMFIGEAPGKVEDMRAKPFVGPSGKLLDQAIEDAVELFIKSSNATKILLSVPKYYITNIVACFPKDSKGKARPPTGEEVIACMPRLEAEIAMINPRVVVFLGKTAATYGKKYFPHGHHLYHPAYILRSGGKGTPVYLEFVRALSEIVQLCENH